MHATWVIAKRELASFFDSLIAYIMLVLFLGFSGFFTWLLGSDIFYTGQASLESFLILFLPPNEKQIDGWPLTIRQFAFVNFSTALPYCF